ncbi:MAG: 4-(cytidine 5'-diphospho)-2-C-methyl-D-erythritol kinase [Eubacteriales bacterium]|nr:4-(cytidine 5'-diphospho)-2-C-methyl-D-erythritol kinase [Eubacteriales bacterium]
METIQLRAYAKINLGLDVLRRRPDGYHEVRMVMQTVGIWDELEFERIGEDVIRISADMQELPVNENNLIYRAVKRMKAMYGIREGVSVRLRKKIPVAAGMAGGSADAAAAIHAVDRLFGLGLSLAEKQAVGVRLGADVPYCLMGGTALAEGIGEVLTALPDTPGARLVVAKPNLNVSTKFVYENLHAERLSRHPDIDGMVESIRKGSLQGVTERMGNVLETVTCRSYPIIGQMKGLLMENGAMNALMSGSGPTVFGVFSEGERARQAYDAMEKSGLARQLFLTEFVGTEGLDERV